LGVLLAALAVSALLPTLAVAQTVALPLLPSGIAYDAAGNLYFADTNRNQVFESTLAGALLVVAGSGVQGYSGDGGAAIGAELNRPQGIAIGPDATLYIADTGNQRIRSVAAGQIATFAGTAGFGGAATVATFHTPTALAVDASGALLVCDTGNQRILRISAGVATTIAGDGVQGFSGDGGAATSAELDTPAGVAVARDGRIFIADSHNARLRVIATDGTITTFAGTGQPGYSGDGGAATAAELSLPRGVSVTSAGAVLFADSNNQRLRMVNAQGTISTIAGSGVQGATSDGSAATAAALNTPRGVAVSSVGLPALADSSSRSPSGAVRELATNGDLYLPAALATPPRSSSVALMLPGNATYGSSAAVSVTGSAGTPQGVVQLLDSGTVVAQTGLTAGSATFSLAALPPGAHTLTASYRGDGINPAATSAISTVTLGAATVIATASPQTIEYGQPIPALTGSLSGVLAQDSGNVAAVFSTTAAALSPPGIYPVAATLTGPDSGDYNVVMATGSGSLQIVTAAASVVEQPLAQASYAGLPLLLAVHVSTTTQGTPTGAVNFLDGGTTVATAQLANGVASATYLSPAGGNHSIVAAYMGDIDFSASTSAAVTTVVGTMPDFAVSFAGSSTQTVAASLIATYQITVAAQSGSFTGAVSMSTSGLPTGATASFSPPQVVPGAGSVSVTMTVQTSADMAHAAPVWPGGTVWPGQGSIALWAVTLPWLLLLRRSKHRRAVLCGLLLLAVAGCGSRNATSVALNSKTYNFTVTGTSTNLAGVVVAHSLPATLVVR
jgi:sugar lactone lactonase YvrE